MGKPISDSNEICRYFQKPLKKVCHNCHHYVKLQGTNKLDGQEIDQWMCADVAAVILAAENAMINKGTGAAVEGLRNRVAEGNQVLADGMKLRAVELLSGHK